MNCAWLFMHIKQGLFCVCVCVLRSNSGAKHAFLFHIERVNFLN